VYKKNGRKGCEKGKREKGEEERRRQQGEEEKRAFPFLSPSASSSVFFSFSLFCSLVSIPFRPV